MKANPIRKMFLLLIGLTYIGLGVYIYMRNFIDTPWSEILAVLFIAYGGWRGYRALKIPEAA